MKTIDRIYLNGTFVVPYGKEKFQMINPTNNQVFGEMTLGDEEDVKKAIGYAKAAFKSFSKTSKQDRIDYLEAMVNAVTKRHDDLLEAMVMEFGAPKHFCKFTIDEIPNSIRAMISTLKTYDFERNIGEAIVRMEPVGVVGIITPWNASNTFICNKLSTAIAAGCTAVIKPAELSGYQTQVIAECLHEVGFPDGVYNIVNGLGNVAGMEIAQNPAVAKISFTGSTGVGKTLGKIGSETFKRLTLELGGKSANIILDDADLQTAIPFSVGHAFFNSGQGCVASTRLLVPESKIEEVKKRVKDVVTEMKVGDPNQENTVIGPMVNVKQYERVQDYIEIGLKEGAEILVGGTGKPEGLENGNFAQPTVFVNVSSNMRIAQEEIFGPVLSILTYKNDEEAVAIANDSIYGLTGYIQSGDIKRAMDIAGQLEVGYVNINGFKHEPLAPFGGVKQSGLGREYGSYGLDQYLESKTINF